MNKKVIKTAIILAWCFLIACVFMKCLGSDVFNAAIENKRILEICAWLDGEGIWARYILMILLYVLSSYFVITASALKTKLPLVWAIITIVVLCGLWTIKYFYHTAGFVCEIVVCIVLPALISKKWWSGFLGTALNMLFQVLSVFLRGADITQAVYNNTIMSLVISIDYYIMIALYYLYIMYIKTKKKEKEEKANG